MPGKPDRLVQLHEAAHIVGIDPRSLQRILRERGWQIESDNTQQPCVKAGDLRELIDSNAGQEAARAAMALETLRRRDEKTSGERERLLAENSARISQYRAFIGELEETHRKYLRAIRPLEGRSPTKAAYLLFAQAINLLNLGCVCLERRYQNAGFILRQVDETVQLALYFQVCTTDPSAQENLDRWYYENWSPSPKAIRRAIADSLPPQLASLADPLFGNLSFLYHQKSKWAHPAFTPIRQILYLDPESSGLDIESIDYADCTYARRALELTEFFESSIWTVVQFFLLCFLVGDTLEQEDRAKLMRMNELFESRINRT